MSDDTASTLTEAEARAELRRRYRIRFLVEVEHEDKSYAARGSTMATTRNEVEEAAVGLLRVMLGRATDQLGRVDPERGN